MLRGHFRPMAMYRSHLAVLRHHLLATAELELAWPRVTLPADCERVQPRTSSGPGSCLDPA